jgi:hypothetical protein
MPNPTLSELARRLNLLEQEVLRLRQLLGVSAVPDRDDSCPVDVDAALDRYFEGVGIQGELSGLAQLRALQAEQEQVWAQRLKNGPAPDDASPRRRKKPGRGA